MPENYITADRPAPSGKPRIDVCVLDFDSCIYPGISKVDLALDITLRIALHPQTPGDRRHLPRLALAGFSLIGLRLAQKISGRPTDGELVRHYQRLVGFLPESYFTASAARLLPRIPGEALQALRRISARVPLGVISLALEPVLDAFQVFLRERDLPGLAFRYGNPIQPSARQVLDGAQKRQLLETAMQRHGWKTPLVIGNDREDLGMAALARACGGSSIGIAPARRLLASFDHPVRNWGEAEEVLETLLA